VVRRQVGITSLSFYLPVFLGYSPGIFSVFPIKILENLMYTLSLRYAYIMMHTWK
jgi:hypothetical protein